MPTHNQAAPTAHRKSSEIISFVGDNSAANNYQRLRAIGVFDMPSATVPSSNHVIETLKDSVTQQIERVQEKLNDYQTKPTAQIAAQADKTPNTAEPMLLWTPDADDDGESTYDDSAANNDKFAHNQYSLRSGTLFINGRETTMKLKYLDVSRGQVNGTPLDQIKYVV